ncbi:MAG: anthranilate phosphoribosyltransferase [Microthrixaceae bacterium]
MQADTGEPVAGVDEVVFEGWRTVLGRLAAGADLTRREAHAALTEVLRGRATNAQIAAFIVAMRLKGETAEEIGGLVDAMLGEAAPLDLPAGTVDVVGTGGSHALRGGSFNVSTVAAIVAAAAGATVCKHGNRKASSTSGSTDLLEALGVAVDLDGAAVRRCVDEAGVGFCFARMFHPAMRHVAEARNELGIPTVFNILGPMAHPGSVRRQVLGVADPARVDVIAEVLRGRGMDRALVVHGLDGLDELTTTDRSLVIDIRGDHETRHEVHPDDVGLEVRSLSDLEVGDPRANAEMTHRVLGGERGAHRDMVVFNAAAGLMVADLVDDLAAGVELAASAVDDGRAAATLERLVAVAGLAVDPTAQAGPSDRDR